LREWVRAARTRLATRSRADIGDQIIGQVLSGASPDSDGLWPPAAVREVIEESSSGELELGIAIGAFNARGVVSKSHHEGGEQEMAIAHRHERMSERLAAGAPRTAQMLRRMADQYRRDAHLSDQEAERRQDADE